jgi:hypothetical protein
MPSIAFFLLFEFNFQVFLSYSSRISICLLNFSSTLLNFLWTSLMCLFGSLWDHWWILKLEFALFVQHFNNFRIVDTIIAELWNFEEVILFFSYFFCFCFVTFSYIGVEGPLNISYISVVAALKIASVRLAQGPCGTIHHIRDGLPHLILATTTKFCFTSMHWNLIYSPWTLPTAFFALSYITDMV